MALQPDLNGNERVLVNTTAEQEFARVFGFSAHILYDAVASAARVARETNDRNAQASAAGSRFYHRFIEAVRQEVDTLEDWSANQNDDAMASPRVRRTDGLAFAFIQGDNATGQITKSPQPKKKLGPATLREIQRDTESDLEQLTLDCFLTTRGFRTRRLWLLLFHRDTDNEYVTLEMSLPTGATDEGRILGWDKRIVLGEVSMHDQIAEVQNDGFNDENGTAVAISAR